MNLSQQVCSPEQAKRLKDLGISQYPAMFYYYEPTINGKLVTQLIPLLAYEFSGVKESENVMDSLKGYTTTETTAAFTVAELGVMLPNDIDGGTNWSWYHRKNWKGNSVGYSAFSRQSIEQDWFKTEAESRAAMLIHLLESGKIISEQVNARLQ